jgi:hypothetical protein
MGSVLKLARQGKLKPRHIKRLSPTLRAALPRLLVKQAMKKDAQDETANQA